MATVTYLGPTTPADPSTQFIAIVAREDGEESFTFPKGVRVYDVPEDALEQVSAARGHRFEVGVESQTEAGAFEGDDDDEVAEVDVVKREDVEPWPGYDEADVPEVTDRLRTAHAIGNDDLLAQVELYEKAHKARKGVLEFDPASDGAAE